MLVCYRMKEVRPPFISRYIVGEETDKGPTTVLTNCIEVCEAIMQNPQGGFQILENAISNQLISQGTIHINKDEVEWEKEVSEEDKLFSTWQKSIQQFRLSLSNLVPPPDLTTKVQPLKPGVTQ